MREYLLSVAVLLGAVLAVRGAFTIFGDRPFRLWPESGRGAAVLAIMVVGPAVRIATVRQRRTGGHG